ncbi:MAG: hypothetical protein LBQ58_10895 [Synergistaceae bacterium]|jgi:hypothetical protein|nr:hypothetical protein [Synergistaceae bacterium]
MRQGLYFAKNVGGMLQFAVVILLVCGASAYAASPIYKNNVLTAQHIVLPGTHVALIPPAGARPAPDFVGFELQSRNIKFVITEKIGASYSESESTLTPEGVEALGITLKESAKVLLNSAPAMLVTGSSNSSESVSVQLLVTGDSKLTVYIYGYYPETDKSAVNTVRNALLSCIFDPSAVKVNSGGYSLSSDGTSFKFADEVNLTRFYTLNGEPVDDQIEEAFYTSTVLNESIAQEDRDTFADTTIARFLSSYEYTVDSRRNVNYAGLSGIETIARFDGASRRVRTSSGGMVTRTSEGKGYQVVLFDNFGHTYVLSGIAVKNADSYLSQFARITSTFLIVK